MGLTNVGRDFIAKAIINDGATFFDSSNAHVGVGDSSTAFSVGQEDLQGSNKTRKVVDSAPIRNGNEIEFRVIFESDQANHAWSEWGVFNHASSGEMLNRKVENLGAKSGGVWMLTVILSVNVG